MFKKLLLFVMVLCFFSCALNNDGQKTKLFESENYRLTTNLPDKYSKVLLQNCETNLKGYKSIFGINLYQKRKIKIFALLNEKKPTRLCVYPNAIPIEIHLNVNKMSDLNRPSEGGFNNIYGFAHELGHVIMLFDDSDFGEGFATYFGIHITDYIYTQLGDTAWPYPYDYVENEGSGMINKMRKNNDKSYWVKTALGLEDVDNKYGKKCIMDAINQVKKNQKPRIIYQIDNGNLISLKVYSKDALIKEISQISGDSNIKSFFQK
jgi:hypothetical protein